MQNGLITPPIRTCWV